MKTNNFAGMKPGKISQRGVGMVEVLVSMLLLAIGVLGYAALQVRAVGATGEALNRSQAMVILRGLAEEIRVNSTVQTGTGGYPSAVQGQYTTLSAPTTNCYTTTCTAAQLASWDAYQSANAASKLGIKINAATCPGVGSTVTVKRQCLYAAWGKTTLDNINPLLASSAVTATDCMDSSGTYQPQATCVMMEAY